jgi:hypothetical protein
MASCDTIGSLAGPVAGVGEWLTLACRARIAAQCRMGRLAARAMFSPRPHGRAVLRYVGCSHKVIGDKKRAFQP